MAKSGLLATSNPTTAGAVLYRAPIDATASAVLSASVGSTASTYTFGIKDYDQDLTLDASTYKFHKGDLISNKTFTLDSAITESDITAKDLITSDDLEKTARFHSFVIPAITTIHVKTETLKSLTLTGATGGFAAGDTLETGTAPNNTVATIFESYPSGSDIIVVIGPETLNGTAVAFAASDTVECTAGTGVGTIATGGIGTAGAEYIFSQDGSAGTYRYHSVEGIFIYPDRTYRFDVSHTSMTGRLFRLSLTINGVWGPDNTFGNADDGVEFTNGKTTSGTAGSASAYVQYNLTSYAFVDNANTSLYFYDGQTGTAGNSGYGGSNRFLTITNAITYDTIRVYDIVGTWVANTDSFTSGNSSYIVTAQDSGKWGVVKSYSGTSLKVSLGLNSSGFAASDTFLDQPLSETATPVTATISSLAVDTLDLPTTNIVVNAKSLSANTTDKHTSVVIGPGQSLVVDVSVNNAVSFDLVGFEDTSDEITTRSVAY